jgi:hypothetical protein
MKWKLKYFRHFFITCWIYEDCSKWDSPCSVHNSQRSDTVLQIDRHTFWHQNFQSCFWLTDFWATLYIALEMYTHKTFYYHYYTLRTEGAGCSEKLLLIYHGFTTQKTILPNLNRQRQHQLRANIAPPQIWSPTGTIRWTLTISCIGQYKLGKLLLATSILSFNRAPIILNEIFHSFLI